MINNKNLVSDILDLNFDSVKKYCDEDYYFQDEVDTLISTNEKIPQIIEKFLLSYLSRISYLCSNNLQESRKFIDWFNKVGNNKLMPVIKNLDFDKINSGRLIKVLTNYDILMEQSIDEKNVDCLVNILIDIPIKLYKKMQEWECLNQSNNILVNNVKTYKVNPLNNSNFMYTCSDAGIFIMYI